MSHVAQPILPPPPTWRRWVWAAGAILAVVVVLVVTYTIIYGLHLCGKDGGLYRRSPNAECVGVTDGTDIFDSGLTKVENLIHRENNLVLSGTQPYVSIVVMLPMTVTSADDDVTGEWIRRQLEGALLAQREANYGTLWGGTIPKLRVLLANAGSGLQQWGTVVDRIESRMTSDHIVAVTGIGLSVRPAGEAVQRLSELKIPVFASTLTADDIGKPPGFVRVSPSDSQEARAAAEFVKNNLGAKRVTVVEDMNPNDLYPRTLADQFSRYFFDADHRPAGTTEPFLSQDAGVANTMSQMVPQFCGTRPQVIYFAGRAAGVRTLMAQLSNRSCPGTDFTIVTGDDLSLRSVDTDAIRTAMKSHIDVYFTGLAHPQSWKLFPGAFAPGVVDNFTRPSGTKHPCETCFRGLFPDENIDDGVAQISHDSVVAAIKAARAAGSETSRQPSAEEVVQSMNRLHGTDAVTGASGVIAFDPDTGNSVDKPIPILKLQSVGSPKFETSICPSGGTDCGTPGG